MKRILLILVALALAAPTMASAQHLNQESGYTIITPGELPTFVNPNYNGGYTAMTPGEPPTFINRSFNGGCTLITPGQPPTFINPTIPSYPNLSPFGANNGSDD